MDEVELITKYASIYQSKLKALNLDHNEVEKNLNEWIKDKLQYVKDNPDIKEKEFINYMIDSIERRVLR